MMTTINKDNIAEVLKHNGIETLSFRSGFIEEYKSLRPVLSVALDHTNLIPIIEAYFGKKLEPLPERSH
jgi:hypothetical protein